MKLLMFRNSENPCRVFNPDDDCEMLFMKFCRKTYVFHQILMCEHKTYQNGVCPDLTKNITFE